MKFLTKKRSARSSDYSFHRSQKLGSAPLPSELLFLSPILNQGEQDSCTAYASVAARYNETNQVFDPEVFYTEEQTFSGSDGSEGFDIEVPAATAVTSGFPSYSPSTYFWVTSG